MLAFRNSKLPKFPQAFHFPQRIAKWLGDNSRRRLKINLMWCNMQFACSAMLKKICFLAILMKREKGLRNKSHITIHRNWINFKSISSFGFAINVNQIKNNLRTVKWKINVRNLVQNDEQLKSRIWTRQSFKSSERKLCQNFIVKSL